MLTRDQAVVSAALELARESELFGVEIVAGAGIETPSFWVFYPNSARALEGARSADSLSYRIPPLVVDRRNGRVTRPVAAGNRVAAADLGAGEWFILQANDRARVPAASATVGLAASDAQRVELLKHFEFRLGGRDGGDLLEARLVATRPDAIELGLHQAGLTRTAHGWTTDGVARIGGGINAEFALLHLTIAGNGDGASAWAVTTDDIAIAEWIESALAGAEWVRFWD